MLTHAQVWSAIDRLAARAGLSASGLAKRAGLDPTTFNQSKRMTAQGRARWPSTESIAKALDATGTSMDVFVELINAGSASLDPAVPLLGFAEAGNGGYFDEAVFRSAKAGTKSLSRRSATSMPMRWKYPASRCSRPIATAT